ncbi:serine/threonine protein kinase, partial [Desulfobulbus sp. AH-315-M07]|nr:serine/threonine protein kinase [Desulfobulbus sp. AH-315-M07]
GRKQSGGGYVLEDLSFLSIVAAQLGSSLDRAKSESSQLDRYHLERRLGTGGMAEVFLAWQVGPGGFERKVAIKRPLPHVCEDANAVAAFLDEARLAAQLDHPNIAQVYDVGESKGIYYLVMEYVDGPSLRHVLRNLGSDNMMPPTIAAALAASVLRALSYAHQQCDSRDRPMNLVHRDITPRNVLLNRRGEVKLVDFGIARAQFQIHVTRTGTIKGTLPYMSPEQAFDRDLDHRSDLYSAGTLLYELVTGTMAYPRGPSHIRAKSAIKLAPDLPKAVDWVLRKAMAYAPADRYNSADEQREALVAAMAPQKLASKEEVAAWLDEHGPPALTDAQTAVTISHARSEADTVVEKSEPDTVVEKKRG